MHDVDRLVQAFRARATSSAAAKLDVLMDLERLDDSRVAPFLVEVLGDECEAPEVRSHLLTRLGIGDRPAAVRPRVAEAMLRIVTDDCCPELRLQAAMALAEFTDVAGVPGVLGRLALDVELPIDLRYSAFTSLEQAGPTPECVALLRQLSTDELLGRSARRELAAWHLT
jgi:hypothetical protein